MELKLNSIAVRIELNKLLEMKHFQALSGSDSNFKKYSSNTMHPLQRILRVVIYKFIGPVYLFEEIFVNLGRLEEAFLNGDFACAKDSLFVDLVVIGGFDLVKF